MTPWTVAHQAPLSMGFSRQCWSGLPFPSPGDLVRPGIKPVSSVLAGRFFTTEPPGKVGTLLTSELERNLQSIIGTSGRFTGDLVLVEMPRIGKNMCNNIEMKI